MVGKEKQITAARHKTNKNMESNSSTSTGGIGFAGALFLVLLVLKLTKVIDWSWWCVTAPLWIWAVLDVIILMAYGIFRWYMLRKINKRKK